MVFSASISISSYFVDILVVVGDNIGGYVLSLMDASFCFDICRISALGPRVFIWKTSLLNVSV
jgi:hypothetical protein